MQSFCSTCVRPVTLALVGAGGLGVEIAKNLSNNFIKRAIIIDLDLIEESNRSRQFVYASSPAGTAKADALASYLTKVVKLPQVDTYCVSVQQVPESIYRSCDLVVGALDNINARKFVNEVCYRLKIPFLDTGATGFSGQVMLYWPSAGIECYECVKKLAQKEIPICTLRGIPQNINQCVAYAKQLVNGILFDDRALKNFIGVELSSSRTCPDEFNKFFSEIFHHIFHNQVVFFHKECLAKPDITQKVFRSLSVDNFEHTLNSHPKLDNYLLQLDTAVDKYSAPVNSEEGQSVNTIANQINDMYLALKRILFRNNPITELDKDDEDVVQLIASITNLRAYCFGINPISVWKVKGIFGELQPVLLATNVVVGGFAAKIMHKIVRLLSEHEKLKTQITISTVRTYISNIWVLLAQPSGTVVKTEQLSHRSENCSVCNAPDLMLTCSANCEQVVTNILDFFAKAKQSIDFIFADDTEVYNVFEKSDLGIVSADTQTITIGLSNGNTLDLRFRISDTLDVPVSFEGDLSSLTVT